MPYQRRGSIPPSRSYCPLFCSGFFMPIYTRTGDKGETSIWRGKRVKKTSARIKFLGELDELNALIGVVRQEIKLKENNHQTGYYLSDLLLTVQKQIMQLSSSVAGKTYAPEMWKVYTEELESRINEISGILLTLKNFLIPSGSLMHVRAVCRRVERSGWEHFDGAAVYEMTYINRLSDLLFVASRWHNQMVGIKEVIWKNGEGR